MESLLHVDWLRNGYNYYVYYSKTWRIPSVSMSLIKGAAIDYIGDVLKNQIKSPFPYPVWGTREKVGYRKIARGNKP